MKILVSGGQGFLGRRVIDFLTAAGYRARALVRRPAPELEALGVETAPGDLLDVPSLDSAVKGLDGVIHCAAKSGVWGTLDSFVEANFVTTVNLLSAARRGGAAWFVHASSPSVVHTGAPLNGVDESAPYTGNPAHGYPYSKMLAERAVLAADGPGFRTTALRPHLIWGPGDPHFLPRLMDKARQNRLWLLRSEALVDGVYIDNAARAHVLAAEKLARQSAGGPAGPAGGPAGRAYFIAQGEPLTAGELIGRILAAAAAARGEELAIRGFWPAGPGRIAARALETAWKILPLAGEPPLTSFVAEELTLPHWFNLDRARLDLGYEPTISLAEGLRLLAGKGGENKLL